MSKNRPLTEVQILNGTHDVATKTGGKGFGAGSIVSANAAAETITISNAQAAPVAVGNEPEAAPAVTETQIQEMINAALATTTSQITEAQEQAKAEAATAIEEAKQAANDAIEKAKAEAAAEIERLNNELAEAKKGSDALTELGKLTGAAQVAETKTLEVLGTGSQEMRNWQQMIDNAPIRSVQHNNRAFGHKDLRSADNYLAKHRKAIREGIEAELRDAGCLQGSVIGVTNAPTLMADIPSTAFNYLADEIRRTSDTDLIYEQFARTHSVPGTAPRFQGQVPRYPFNPGPAVPADRELTPGTDTNATSQNVVEALAPVTIKELGLGKDGSNNAIGLATFVSAYSMTDLVEIVRTNLGRDYAQTKDLYLRSIWFGATTTLYNNGGATTATPANLTTGKGGMLTRAFLGSLRTYLKNGRVPTYRGGFYVLTVTPGQLQNLVTELRIAQSFTEPTSQQVEMVSRIFATPDGAEYGGAVSGFRLICDGFMIFEQNTHSLGAAATEGVQSETLGVGATVTETCFAAGSDTMCWATALPVEIRQDEFSDFGRRDRWIWYSHENAAALDVNEVITSGRIMQERRVVKVNFTRAAI